MAVGTALAIAGTAASVFNSVKGARAADRAARNAMPQGVALTPFLASGGAGGMTAGYGGQGAVNLNYGALSPAMSGLAGYTSNLTGTLNPNAGLPFGVQQALATVNNNARFNDPTAALSAGLSGGLGSAFGNAQEAYNTLYGASAPSMSNLAGTSFAGAAQQAALAGQGFQDVYGSTLGNLRAQAQPFEERQFNSLNQNLFSTGRLGTSGGALQTEAFARGLGQADLARQLEATNQARLTQQQALSQAQGLTGIGTGLLQNAFGNFSNAAGLYGNSIAQRFQNAALVNSQNFNQSQQGFANAVQAAGLPAGLQGAQLQNLVAAINAQGGIQGQGLNLFNAGLNAEQVRGNLAIGNQSNVVAAAQNPNIGATNETLAGIFGGIANRVGGNTGGGLLGGLFGRGSYTPSFLTPTPMSGPSFNNYQLDPSLISMPTGNF